MNDAILVELRFFGTSVLWGMLLLIIYDVLRIVRRIIIHNAFFVSVEDILYWVISSLLIFHMMYQQNNGIIRGFAILAMLLGMVLYHVCASDSLVELISGIINKIIELVGKFISLLLWPFKFLFLKLHKLFAWLFSKTKKLFPLLLKPLKNIRKSSKMEKENNREAKQEEKQEEKKKREKNKAQKIKEENNKEQKTIEEINETIKEINKKQKTGDENNIKQNRKEVKIKKVKKEKFKKVKKQEEKGDSF